MYEYYPGLTIVARHHGDNVVLLSGVASIEAMRQLPH